MSGNSNQCSMDVTVLDVTNPNLTCGDDIEDIANEGSCSATEVFVGGVSTNDACGIGSIENDAPDVFQLGETTVTWTVTDNSGNISTCEITVTIIDTQSPIVECPDPVEVETDEGLCTASGVDLGVPVASDNCDAFTIENNAPEIYELGSTVVVWTISDFSGNSTTCEQTVVVVDNDGPNPPPAPGDLIIDADEGTCEVAALVLDDLIVSDNCTGEITVSNNLDDFLPLPVGTTTITWTIIDANGNVITITQDIVVEDNQPPVITCPEDQTVENEFRECWAVVEIEAPDAADNCDVASVLNDYNNTINATDTFLVGVTEVVWTVTDIHGNTTSCTQIVTVLDGENPSLACPPNVAMANDPGFCGAEVVVLPALASDNCGIDTLYNTYNNGLDASDFYPVGETTITWITVDVNGNETTCDMNVNIVDTELPVIECPNDITANTDPGVCDVSLIVPQPVVMDNCEAVFVNDVNGTNNASGSYTGVTIVTWTATDASGNQASCEHTITILDEEPPVIICPGDITQNNDPGECGAVVTFEEITATDNCEVDEIILIEGINNGDYVPVGDTLVTYEVVDNSGNTASCTFNVTVVDIEPPVITCPEMICIEDSATVVEYDLPEVSDNCSFDLLQIEGLASGEVFEHGETLNTFIVTDEGGLTAECSFTILVDNPPVAVDDVVTVTATGSEIEIDPLINDFDLDDHDSILVVLDDYEVSIGEVLLIDESYFIYNAPEDWCGLATISYIISDEHGKKDSALINIYVNCPEDLFIPEGISPDGDGSNDTFEIIGLWQYPDNKLTVFNRWGHEVFDMEGYDNSWDGTSTDKLTLGSSPLPRGTYFYLLDLGNGEEPIKGFVYVLNR